MLMALEHCVCLTPFGPVVSTRQFASTRSATTDEGENPAIRVSFICPVMYVWACAFSVVWDWYMHQNTRCKMCECVFGDECWWWCQWWSHQWQSMASSCLRWSPMKRKEQGEPCRYWGGHEVSAEPGSGKTSMCKINLVHSPKSQPSLPLQTHFFPITSPPSTFTVFWF